MKISALILHAMEAHSARHAKGSVTAISCTVDEICNLTCRDAKSVKTAIKRLEASGKLTPDPWGRKFNLGPDAWFVAG